VSELLFELSDVYMEGTENIVIPCDCSSLLGDICINRIGGIAYKNMNKLKNFRVLKEFKTTIEAVYKDNIRKTESFKKNIKYLSQIFKDVNFNYAFLKGSFLTTKLYESGYRTSNDIDILINENDITNCQNVLLNNGFVQGEYKKDVGIIPANRREILMSRMNYGETIPFVKMIEDEPVNIDLNFSVDFKPAGQSQIVSELLMNTIEVEFENVCFKTLNRIDFLIHLCCHLYKEATTINWVRSNRDLQLYKFSDINIFFHECILKEDFQNIVKCIAEFGVEKECYYTFENASVIYPNLKKIEGFEKMLNDIKPKDIKFMKQIYDPMDKNVYEYDITFEEWFMSKKRISHLRKVEVASNEV
jgi:hypothetical protein